MGGSIEGMTDSTQEQTPFCTQNLRREYSSYANEVCTATEGVTDSTQYLTVFSEHHFVPKIWGIDYHTNFISYRNNPFSAQAGKEIETATNKLTTIFKILAF